MKVEQVNPYDDKRNKTSQVEAMFDSIAPAYDFMNRAMTFGLDRLWLRSLVKAVRRSGAREIVDMATGTGDVALALARRIPGTSVTGLDLSEGMLSKARVKAKDEKVSFRQADCLATGLPDASVDAVTVAYGVRNYADIAAGYREMARILRPGGSVFILELSTPVSPLTRPLYRLYTRYIIPAVGRLVSGDSRAYSYLPESIAAAPQRSDMTEVMTSAGLSGASFRSLSFGVCTLYTAKKL